MRAPAKDALKRTTKQEVAAAEAGISQSRLSHKFADGSLTVAQMEAFGPTFAAEYGRQLVETFAPLDSPKARAERKLREAQACLDEIRQLVEHLT